MNGRKSFGAKKGGRAGAGAQGKDGQRRPMFRRRKVCKFCSDKIDDINYKDAKLLLPFVPEPIKTIGEHKVPLKLHREVTVPLVVKVIKEGTEAR